MTQIEPWRGANRLDLRLTVIPGGGTRPDRYGVVPIIDGLSLLDVFGPEEFAPTDDVEFALPLVAQPDTIDLLRGRPTASPHFVVGSVRHGVPPVSGAALLELTHGSGPHAGMFVPVRSRSRHGSM